MPVSSTATVTPAPVMPSAHIEVAPVTALNASLGCDWGEPSEPSTVTVTSGVTVRPTCLAAATSGAVSLATTPCTMGSAESTTPRPATRSAAATLLLTPWTMYCSARPPLLTGAPVSLAAATPRHNVTTAPSVFRRVRPADRRLTLLAPNLILRPPSLPLA